MNWRDPKYLDQEYNQKERSASDIAKEHNTFPNTVRRELKKLGFKVRDKSEAQKLNIKRNGTPTEGRQRTEEEKLRISSGLQGFWDGLGESGAASFKKKLSETARGKWEQLTEEERNSVIKKMHSASRRRMRGGSKNENMVADLIREAGYKIEQRTNEYTPNRVFEIDICIPSLNIAIEWDGATHFDPIYGEEHLANVQEKDDRKNQILLAAGWTVIRCRDHSTTSSIAFCKRAIEKIKYTIEYCDKNKLHILECY